MSVNLCIDIGNSRVKMALFEKDAISQFVVFEGFRETDILQWIGNIVFERGIYSSVLKSIPEWLLSISNKENVIKLEAGLKIPLKINYKTPETLGSDRIAAMVGAIALYPNSNLLIVNAGTCVTYDLVNKLYEFIGGNIAPGLDMRWKAMHEFTSSLPRVKEIDPNADLLGIDTLTALQNGGLQGIIFEIEGYFNNLINNYSNLICIITGGSAPFLVNHLKIGNFAEPYLVLKGLNSILNYQ